MNSAILALKSDIVTFIAVKSIQVISAFNLKRMKKKMARWGCGTKMSKANVKTMISPRGARCVKKSGRPK